MTRRSSGAAADSAVRAPSGHRKVAAPSQELRLPRMRSRARAAAPIAPASSMTAISIFVPPRSMPTAWDVIAGALAAAMSDHVEDVEQDDDGKGDAERPQQDATHEGASPF